jgi:hypothetical protein
MTNALIILGVFLFGILTGVGLIRYGIILGTKIEKDEVLSSDLEIEQESTE